MICFLSLYPGIFLEGDINLKSNITKYFLNINENMFTNNLAN